MMQGQFVLMRHRLHAAIMSRLGDKRGSAAQGLDLLRDLLTVEVPLTLNAALCEFHHGHCPATAELELECGRVRSPAWCLQACLAIRTWAPHRQVLAYLLRRWQGVYIMWSRRIGGLA